MRRSPSFNPLTRATAPITETRTHKGRFRTHRRNLDFLTSAGGMGGFSWLETWEGERELEERCKALLQAQQVRASRGFSSQQWGQSIPQPEAAGETFADATICCSWANWPYVSHRARQGEQVQSGKLGTTSNTRRDISLPQRGHKGISRSCAVGDPRRPKQARMRASFAGCWRTHRVKESASSQIPPQKGQPVTVSPSTS